MTKYRKKPVEIEAFRYTLGCPYPRWFADALSDGTVNVHRINNECFVACNTLEGIMRGEEGDWIIKGVKGEIYPCKSDIFELTYEPVGEVPPEKVVMNP